MTPGDSLGASGEKSVVGSCLCLQKWEMFDMMVITCLQVSNFGRKAGTLKGALFMRIGLKRANKARKKSQIPPAPWQEFIEF